MQSKTIKRYFVLVTFLMLLGNFSEVLAKSISISVDKMNIEMGDIINLTIKADFQIYSQSPNLTPLKKDFQILGQQRSNNMTMVNGNMNSYTEWLIQMTPKKPGSFVIPSFTLDGVSSAPLTLKVSKASLVKGHLKSSFLKVSLSRQQAYVQQQVIYTLRYYHLGQLITGSMRPPKFGNAIVKPLKKQFTYQQQLDGKIYEVIEWKYAIFPQTSGTLNIESVDFSGRIQTQGRLQAVQNESSPLSLKVLPKPLTYPKNQTWIPATKVMLTEPSLSNSHPIHVGDSFTRTFALKVVGQMDSQLPTLSFKNGSNYHIYADKPKYKELLDTSRGLTATAVYKMAVVPTKAGIISLPKITINWWDISTQQLKTASLPAQKLTVLPALASANKPTINAIQKPISKPQSVIKSSAKSDSSAYFWPIVVGIVIFLWLLTLGYIWTLKQQLKAKKVKTLSNGQDEPQAVSQDTKESTLECDATQSPQAFYQFLQAQWQQQPDLKSLLMKNKEFDEAYQALKAHLYQGLPLEENTLEQLCKRLQLEQNQPNKPKSPSQLLPLYP